MPAKGELPSMPLVGIGAAIHEIIVPQAIFAEGGMRVQ